MLLFAVYIDWFTLQKIRQCYKMSKVFDFYLTGCQSGENFWELLPVVSLQTGAASCTLFSYENLVSMAQEFSRKCGTLRCENSILAIILLNYGMSMHNLSALNHFVGRASKT